MPKERFHLYLADELLNGCAGSLKELGTSRSVEFFIGTISPDIFFYDLPSFSLSPLGNALHDLVDRQGISPIGDWIAQTRPLSKTASAERVLWALGFACHFLADAAWHPVINGLSGSMDYCGGKRLSEIECHRLLESELEALWLARSRTPQRYTDLLKDFGRDRDRLFEIASNYRRFLDYVGLDAGVSETRILRCYLRQNLFLRLFANRMLGRHRDRMLDLPYARYPGSLITPARPVLPALFSRTFPEERNPFSDYFMEQALTSLKANLCAFAERLSQFLT
ncbi:MAG: zinc dependent phospholipase C family protein [Syntrophobacteraceae bacterium]|jgi:hypothetical protein